MGKKKGKKPSPVYDFEPPQQDDDGDFAAQLLAEMGLDEDAPPSTEPETQSQPEPEHRPKRNRRKEKLAQREAETQKLMQKADEEAAGQPQYRQIELDQLKEKFAARNLEEIDIRPDGNCLFSSISDQLKHRCDIDVTAQKLRQKSADYILAHKDDFMPFLLSEDSDELRDVDEYCKELVETPMWGGEMEILALSSCYGCPIEVLQAGPSHIVGENLDGETLLVSYYTRIYGLGAHYNSVR